MGYGQLGRRTMVMIAPIPIVYLDTTIPTTTTFQAIHRRLLAMNKVPRRRDYVTPSSPCLGQRAYASQDSPRLN
jgi:hypothetical protein